MNFRNKKEVIYSGVRELHKYHELVTYELPILNKKSNSIIVGLQLNIIIYFGKTR